MITERNEARIYPRRDKKLQIIFQLARNALIYIGGASFLFACAPASPQPITADSYAPTLQTPTTILPPRGLITRLPTSVDAEHNSQPASGPPTPPPEPDNFDSNEFASLLDGIGSSPDDVREWTLYAALIGSLTASERDTYSTFVKDSTRMIKFLNSTPSATEIGRSDIDVRYLRAQRPNSGINYQVYQIEKGGGVLTLVNDGKEVVGFDLVRKSPKTSALTPNSAFFETSAYVKPNYQQQGNFTRLRSLSIRGLAQLSELADTNWTITSRIINTKLATQLSTTLTKLGYTIAKDNITAYFSATPEQTDNLIRIPLAGESTAVGSQKAITIRAENVPGDLPARISIIATAPLVPKSGGGTGKNPANAQPTLPSRLP